LASWCPRSLAQIHIKGCFAGPRSPHPSSGIAAGNGARGGEPAAGDPGQLGHLARAALGDALRRNVNVLIGWQSEDPATTPAVEVEAAVRRLWPVTIFARERAIEGDRWVMNCFGESATFPKAAIERTIDEFLSANIPTWQPGAQFRARAVKPQTKDFTDTVRLLANLSHFVIVDITNPRSTPLELQAAVPDYMVPFVPILQQGEQPFAMFVDLQNKYDWVLKPTIAYSSVDRLLEVLEEKIVRRAEAKFKKLLARRTKKICVENV
jgi:hypothetical protein